MVSSELAQAQTQIAQAKQVVQQQRSAVSQAEQTLKQQEQKLPSSTSAMALRQSYAGLQGRNVRQQIEKVKQDIQGRREQIKQYKEGVLTPYESQIKDYEKQIEQAQKQEGAFEALQKYYDTHPKTDVSYDSSFAGVIDAFKQIGINEKEVKDTYSSMVYSSPEMATLAGTYPQLEKKFQTAFNQYIAGTPKEEAFKEFSLPALEHTGILNVKYEMGGKSYYGELPNIPQKVQIINGNKGITDLMSSINRLPDSRLQSTKLAPITGLATGFNIVSANNLPQPKSDKDLNISNLNLGNGNVNVLSGGIGRISSEQQSGNFLSNLWRNIVGTSKDFDKGYKNITLGDKTFVSANIPTGTVIPEGQGKTLVEYGKPQSFTSSLLSGAGFIGAKVSPVVYPAINLIGSTPLGIGFTPKYQTTVSGLSENIEKKYIPALAEVASKRQGTTITEIVKSPRGIEFYGKSVQYKPEDIQKTKSLITGAWGLTGGLVTEPFSSAKELKNINQAIKEEENKQFKLAVSEGYQGTQEDFHKEFGAEIVRQKEYEVRSSLGLSTIFLGLAGTSVLKAGLKGSALARLEKAPSTIKIPEVTLGFSKTGEEEIKILTISEKKVPETFFRKELTQKTLSTYNINPITGQVTKGISYTESKIPSIFGIFKPTIYKVESTLFGDIAETTARKIKEVQGLKIFEKVPQEIQPAEINVELLTRKMSISSPKGKKIIEEPIFMRVKGGAFGRTKGEVQQIIYGGFKEGRLYPTGKIIYIGKKGVIEEITGIKRGVFRPEGIGLIKELKNVKQPIKVVEENIQRDELLNEILGTKEPKSYKSNQAMESLKLKTISPEKIKTSAGGLQLGIEKETSKLFKAQVEKPILLKPAIVKLQKEIKISITKQQPSKLNILNTEQVVSEVPKTTQIAKQIQLTSKSSQQEFKLEKIQETKLLQLQKQAQKQAQKQESKYVQVSKMATPLVNTKVRTPFKPIPPLSKRRKSEDKLPKGFIEDMFTAIGKRKGKFFELGKYKTQTEAERSLLQFEKGTLGASGKIKKGERELSFKELRLFQTPEFRPSKISANVAVQKRSFRLGSGGEKAEIISSKKRSKNLKWV